MSIVSFSSPNHLPSDLRIFFWYFLAPLKLTHLSNFTVSLTLSCDQRIPKKISEVRREVFWWSKRYNWHKTIEKSCLSFTVWPHERSTFKKKVTRKGHFPRPGETDPYVDNSGLWATFTFRLNQTLSGATCSTSTNFNEEMVATDVGFRIWINLQLSLISGKLKLCGPWNNDYPKQRDQLFNRLPSSIYVGLEVGLLYSYFSW